jgi:hypothetical protein
LNKWLGRIGLEILEDDSTGSDFGVDPIAGFIQPADGVTIDVESACDGFVERDP